MPLQVASNFARAAAAVALITALGTGPAAALSPEAKLIYKRSGKIAKLNKICRSRDHVTKAVTKAVGDLVREKKLTGVPRKQAREAGKYIMLSCGKH